MKRLDELLSIAQKGMKTYKAIKDAAKIIETGDIGLAFTKIIGHRFHALNTPTAIDAKQVTDDSSVGDKLMAINQNTSNTALFAEHISQNVETLVDVVDSQKESMANLGVSIVKEIKTLEKVLDSQNEEGDNGEIGPLVSGSGSDDLPDEDKESGKWDKFEKLLKEQAKDQIIKGSKNSPPQKMNQADAPKPESSGPGTPPLPSSGTPGAAPVGSAPSAAGSAGAAGDAVGSAAVAADSFGVAEVAEGAASTGASSTAAAAGGGSALGIGSAIIAGALAVASGATWFNRWRKGKRAEKEMEQEAAEEEERSKEEAAARLANVEHIREGYAENSAAEIIKNGGRDKQIDETDHLLSSFGSSTEKGMKAYIEKGLGVDTYFSSWEPIRSPDPSKRELADIHEEEKTIGGDLNQNIKTSAIAIEDDPSIEDKEAAYKKMETAAMEGARYKEQAQYLARVFLMCAAQIKAKHPEAAKQLSFISREVAKHADSMEYFDQSENSKKDIKIEASNEARKLMEETNEDYVKHKEQQNSEKNQQDEPKDESDNLSVEPSGETTDGSTAEDVPNNLDENAQIENESVSPQQTSEENQATVVPEEQVSSNVTYNNQEISPGEQPSINNETTIVNAEPKASDVGTEQIEAAETPGLNAQQVEKEGEKQDIKNEQIKESLEKVAQQGENQVDVLQDIKEGIQTVAKNTTAQQKDPAAVSSNNKMDSIYG